MSMSVWEACPWSFRGTCRLPGQVSNAFPGCAAVVISNVDQISPPGESKAAPGFPDAAHLFSYGQAGAFLRLSSVSPAPPDGQEVSGSASAYASSSKSFLISSG